ncbi:tyrosine phosphatase domain-containing protein [Acrasis kona]|uniref:Tyrosine phosphatase domain-containing protein n=1 Tax=Acrasis kona TaxID=1008807 RepID=A0AAW2YS99_9EUKA
MNWHSFQCHFCGGDKCRHEDFNKTVGNPAIYGLHSNYVTDNIIASQRLSSRLIQQHDIYAQFKKHKVFAIVNLQERGEHPHCGDGNLIESGFSYSPEEVMSHNINFYNFFWRDMSTPSNAQYVMNIMHVMHSDIEKGGKVLVHCHAGLGRTGLIIACYLLYSKFSNTPEEAINFTRQHRAKSIQTQNQVNYVYIFHEYLIKSKCVFPLEKQTLKDSMFRQRCYLSGEPYRVLRNIPKIIDCVCKILSQSRKSCSDINQIIKRNQSYIIEDPDRQHNDQLLLSDIKNRINDDDWGILSMIDDRLDLGFCLLFDWLSTLSEPILSDKNIQDMLEMYDQIRDTSINLTIQLLVSRCDVGKVECEIIARMTTGLHNLCSMTSASNEPQVGIELCCLVLSKLTNTVLKKNNPLCTLFFQTTILKK